ncbi:hypothetical protein F0562_034532 [Nyssa sinensis]|uniref:Protein kinase domain-containing protein n=1 Tax=Nyssa sinensis TaxID=561372 RepID=A0A5J5AI10_9ASTE|nr:hypothetical protein F0562_034532 [Nyssa sinensis]
MDQSKYILLIDNQFACPNELTPFAKISCFDSTTPVDGSSEDDHQNKRESMLCLVAKDIVKLEKCDDGKPIVAKKVNTAPTNAISYSIADLQMAMGSFSMENFIGEGSIGCVHQAQFDDGKVLAEKIINSFVLSKHLSEDFMDIVLDISRKHHPNVTEPVGYCSEHGQHLLVYELHKNGSQHDLLHLLDEDGKPLTWNTRVKIALGTALALEYLHEVCSPSVVHKNFKSDNILLDMKLNPHYSDFGLASFVLDADKKGINSHLSQLELYCYDLDKSIGEMRSTAVSLAHPKD